MVKSFKEFTQSSDAGYDWGTDKAADRACDLTPGQRRNTKEKKKKYGKKEQDCILP